MAGNRGGPLRSALPLDEIAACFAQLPADRQQRVMELDGGTLENIFHVNSSVRAAVLATQSEAPAAPAPGSGQVTGVPGGDDGSGTPMISL